MGTAFAPGASVCSRSFVSRSAGVSVDRVRQNAVCPLKMSLLGHEELEILFDGGDFKTAKYRLDCRISGDASKQARKVSIRSIKENARFDGFRKGTIPPFVMAQVNEFVLRDCITDEVTEACKELDLAPVEGEASEPEVEFKELLSKFEVGKDLDFSFTMALKSSFAAAAEAELAATGDGPVIDVSATKETSD